MVAHIGRDEFLDEYWDYRPGEHLNLIAPTGGGKTHLKAQLLHRALRQNPQLRYAGMMPKPSDATTVQMAEAFGFRIKDSYPFRKKFWENEAPGHILWPKHIRGDEKANREQLQEVFRQALSDLYWNGNVIVDADDVYLIACLLKMNPELETYWTAGRDPGSGLWTANQKPSGTINGGSVSSYSYSAPTHLFLGRDGDKRNLERFGEIGMGFDTRDIQDIVRNLRVRSINDASVSEFLYLDRRGPFMAVIGID